MRTRHHFVTWAAAGIALFPALALPSLALEVGANLELHPIGRHPSARVTAIGTGFGPSEVVQISFDSSPVGEATTDLEGEFSVWFRIPRSATPGRHQVNARGETSGLQADRGLSVTTPWRGSGFDMQGNRFNRYENVLTPATVGELTKQWGWMVTGEAISSPVAVAGGVAYVSSEPGGISGPLHPEPPYARADMRADTANVSFDLAAIDVRLGAELWEVSLSQGEAHSAPLIARGMVYVGISDVDSSALFALDASTGATIWSYESGPILGSAVLRGHRVYFSSSTAIYALDAASGDLQWTFPISRGEVEGTPALSGDLLFVQSWDSVYGTNVIYAVDVNSGRQRWKVSLIGGCGLTSDTDQSPVVAGDTVYVSSTDGSLHAFDAADGAERWSFEACRETLSTPVVAHGSVYLAFFSGSVVAVDAATGVEQWRFSSTLLNWVRAPAVAGDVLYVGGDTTIVALDAVDGAVVWSNAIDNGIVQQPLVVSDGVLYEESCCEVAAFALPGAA